VKTHMVNGIAIVAPPHSHLVGGKETDELQDAIRDLMDHGNRCLVVDLGSVIHMTSIVIGMLVGFHTSYANRNGHMKLCNVDKRIDNIFIITKLSFVFDVYPSERKAIESFAPGTCA
jgi:anti-sigma B factor antagonist